MATSIGLIVIVALLVAGGATLARGSRLKRLDRWQKFLLSTLLVVGLVFLAWLAIMVLVVGPSMRAI